MCIGQYIVDSSISDAFAGGFVAGIVEGKSLDESVDMGHWLASLSIKELGPQYVRSLLTTHYIVLPSSASHQATTSNSNLKSTLIPFVLSIAI